MSCWRTWPRTRRLGQRHSSSPITTPVSWTRPASNPRDVHRCCRRSSASMPISSRDQLGAALGATLRTDVDVLNSTNLYTGHLFGLWVAQDLNDPDRYSPFLLQGGLGMAGPGVLRQSHAADGEHSAKIPSAYRGRARTGRREERPRARGTDIRARDAHGAGALDASRLGTDRGGQQSLEPPAIRRPGPGPELATILRRRRLGKAARFRGSGSPVRSSASPNSPRLNRSRYGRITCASMRWRTPAPYLPKKFVDENFAFLWPGPVRHAATAPALEARRVGCRLRLGRCGRQALCAGAIFRRRKKWRAETWCAICWRRFSARIDGLEWMAAANQGDRQGKARGAENRRRLSGSLALVCGE